MVIREVEGPTFERSPEVRNNLYALVQSSINAIDNGQPQGHNEHNAEIESLQKQPLDSNNNTKEEAAQVKKIEATLKVATLPKMILLTPKTIEDL
ncbi:hypothetical protein V8E51_014378 [Hyaloscypha variabilis]